MGSSAGSTVRNLPGRVTPVRIILYLGERAQGAFVRAVGEHHLHKPEKAGTDHLHIARILGDLGLKRLRLATAEGSSEVVERRDGELEVVEYSRG